MRKAQKKQAEDFLELLGQAHEEIKKQMEAEEISIAMELLEQCQEGAIQLGNLVEKTEGKDFPLISLLEKYCEAVYQIHEEISQCQQINVDKVYENLYLHLRPVEEGFRDKVKVRLEVVFLPYKASMWDSLESIWKAADEDPDCDAYVVPIPYYNKNSDGRLGGMHYEGNHYPAHVPVTYYKQYQFEERKPDVIYIHNPYDNANYVTSVDPFFYSANLKKYTDCLVYIPYYVTTGGMSEGQALCPAYFHADYIVIQAEKYRSFFAGEIPDDKFLAFGSPKLDSVIQKCQNPPSPPKDWKEKLEGRKVYFYNTSINGMLGNTETFLKKMRYVFDLFMGRKDACLLWRPHPLLESTFDSMRKDYKARYDALKEEFISENIGIYDETPDIESTIALSDAYIGDKGTSVTALFGAAGKPLFIFKNEINSLPGKADWRGGQILFNPAFCMLGNDRYYVTGNNQLWFSENNDFHYKFYMDLGSGYSGGGYYLKAVELKGAVYVIPGNARHLLIIRNKKIKRIAFKAEMLQTGAFYNFLLCEKYIFLFPMQYPYLIRFHIDSEKIDYIDGVRQFNVKNVNGEWRMGGLCFYEKELVIASPTDNTFLFVEIDTLKTRKLIVPGKSSVGAVNIVPEGDILWLLPMTGMTITRWNPKTGETREYSDLPSGFRSVSSVRGYLRNERPFWMTAFSRDGRNIIVSPFWGNMFLRLDRNTGEMKEWKAPVAFSNQGKNGYFVTDGIGGIFPVRSQSGETNYRLWYAPEGRLYDIDIDTGEGQEVEIQFDYEEVRAHEPGFMEESEWMQYCLQESAFNSLEDFLEDHITGNPFDRDRQLGVFSKINANTEGTCGRNIHHFIKEKLS